MTKRFRSLCTFLATTAALSLAGQQLFAQATLVTSTSGDSRAPITQNTPTARIPAGAFQAGRDFDTTLVSSDYYNFTPLVSAPPNPDIAVGPDDIVMVVGSNQIARFPNPNATTPPPGSTTLPALSGCGWAPPGGPNASNTGATCGPTTGAYGAPTNQEFMSVWLGGTNLSNLCPTIPRTPQSCVIGNAKIRYDQMQGHFLVLFTVVDLGATQGQQALTLGPQATRQANWVLLVSRFAALNIPSTGSTEVFTTPQPPGTTGGVNTGNWLIYTGNINSGAPTGYTIPQGFAAPSCLAGATAPNPCFIPTESGLGIDNDNIIVTATVFNDNIPLASRLGPVTTLTLTAGGSGFTSNPTVSITGGGGTGATATATITGTVAALTITNAGTGYTSAPTVTISGGGGTGATATATVTTGFVTALTITNAGTGYTSAPTVSITGGGGTGAAATASISGSVTGLTLTSQGSGFTSAPTVAITGGGGTGATATAAITPVVNPYSGTRVRVYKKNSVYAGVTSGTSAGLTAGNGVGNGTAAPPANTTKGDFYDLFPFAAPWTLNDATGSLVYEPEHLRGRALASFSGEAVGAPAISGVAYLVGTVANATAANTLNVQAIRYTPTTFSADNSPAMSGGIPYLSGAPTVITVPTYSAPGGVPQAVAHDGSNVNGGQSSITLNVGDGRPQRVVAREGMLYDARAGLDTPVLANLFNPNAASGSTVIYDIVNTVQAVNVNTPVAPYLAFKTEWQNGNFFAPMFDVPADVITYGSVSPVNVLPYFDKLFVATTYPPLPPAANPVADPRGSQTSTFSAGGGTNSGKNNCRGQEPSVTTNLLSFAGLWDFRCGEDAFDTFLPTVNPFTGLATSVVQYPTRGGATNDPNDLSLWMIGSYPRGRQFSIPGPGQWGTHITNYTLSFPTVDPYNNPTAFYTDVPATHPYFTYIQIARQTEIAPGGRAATTFNPNGLVNRAEMAYWVVRSQMDEQAITDYLTNTGGGVCHFADVACPGNVATAAPPVAGAGPTDAAWARYIEVMWRRGYTKGCQSTNDPTLRYCPSDNLTRGQMSVFLIRAKMNTVFPTAPSGSNAGDTNLPPNGDLFGLQFAGTNYFTDVPKSHAYWWYIQKMRELRITNGNTATLYGPDDNLTRGQIAVFLVRAFFI